MFCKMTLVLFCKLYKQIKRNSNLEFLIVFGVSLNKCVNFYLFKLHLLLRIDSVLFCDFIKTDDQINICGENYILCYLLMEKKQKKKKLVFSLGCL